MQRILTILTLLTTLLIAGCGSELRPVRTATPAISPTPIPIPLHVTTYDPIPERDEVVSPSVAQACEGVERSVDPANASVQIMPRGSHMAIIKPGRGSDSAWIRTEFAVPQEISTVSDLKYVSCIWETRYFAGEYYWENTNKFAGNAYVLSWTVCLIEYSGRKPISCRDFAGPKPPEKATGGDQYGPRPIDKYRLWISEYILGSELNQRIEFSLKAGGWRNDFVFLPGTQQIVASFYDSVTVSDSRTGRLIRSFDCQNCFLDYVADKRLFSYEPMFGQVWDLLSEDSVAHADKKYVGLVSTSPQYFVTGSMVDDLPTIEIHDIASWTLKFSVTGCGYGGSGSCNGDFHAALSPGSNLVAIENYHTVEIFDITRAAVPLRAYECGVNLCEFVFSKDGRNLAIGSDNVAALWNSGDGELIFSFDAGFDRIEDLAFSGDNKTLAISTGKAVYLLDVPSGRQKMNSGFYCYYCKISISEDGTTIATLDEDLVVRIYDLLGGPATPLATDATLTATAGAEITSQQTLGCNQTDLTAEELANCGEHDYLFSGEIINEYGGYQCYYEDQTGAKTAQDTVHLFVDFSVKDALTILGFVSPVFGDSGGFWDRSDRNLFSRELKNEYLTLSSTLSFTSTGFVLDFSIDDTTCKDGSNCGCTFHEGYELIK